METDSIYLQASTLVVEFELIALGSKGSSIMPGVFIAVDTAQRQSPAFRPFIGKNITNSTDVWMSVPPFRRRSSLRRDPTYTSMRRPTGPC